MMLPSLTLSVSLLECTPRLPLLSRPIGDSLSSQPPTTHGESFSPRESQPPSAASLSPHDPPGEFVSGSRRLPRLRLVSLSAQLSTLVHSRPTASEVKPSVRSVPHSSHAASPQISFLFVLISCL